MTVWLGTACEQRSFSAGASSGKRSSGARSSTAILKEKSAKNNEKDEKYFAILVTGQTIESGSGDGVNFSASDGCRKGV